MSPNNTIENSPKPLRPVEERSKRTMNSTGLQQNGISRAFTHPDLPQTSSSSRQPNGLGLAGLIDAAQFNREVERLKTFENWPVSFLSPSTMAAAGFYYLNRQDIVRCAFCGVEVGNWVQGDNPKDDHKRWSPSCSFVRNLPTGNVPIDGDNSSNLRDNGFDTCGRYGIEFRDSPGPENCVNNIKDRPTAALEELGIHKIRAPSFPSYATYEARLQSYEMWPIALKLKPNTLSDAGFFYTGKGDQTICFHCGGGLKDWEESDEPWVEHARWFSKCNFVLMIKGKEFVDEVCGKKIVEDSSDKESCGSSEGNVTVDRNRTPTETVTNKSEIKVTKTSTTETSETASTSTTTTNDRNICKICYMEEMGVLFLPCGHLVACVKCALSLTTCAVCRQPVTATVRAFLS